MLTVNAIALGTEYSQTLVAPITINNPDVSLSSLCTIPGRISPPIPDKLSLHIANIALTSVQSGFPLAGCTTIPFGLLTTIMSLSS